jgi:superfamily I DNA/RNA helicase
MSTFHALCMRILRQDIEKLGYKKNFAIYDEGDTTGLLKKIITRTAAKDEKLDPAVAKSMISKAKNNGWSAPEGDETLVGAVFARYQAELKTLNAVDFDDLLLLAVRLLNEHPEVRSRWTRRYRYLMVDEFQDTNRLQLELVSLLAKGPEAGPDTKPNVAVVGDDDQSIYGWRGAEVSNILEFEAHFPEPTVIKLEQNYRSTNAILSTANSLIRNNPRRRPKKLWSAMEGGNKVRILQMPDDRQEAEFIAQEIDQRVGNEGVKHEDFAILYRMNAQSRSIEQQLRELRIPYRVVGGKSFFDAREIKDFLAYASCLLNAEDDVSLLRIINTPARGIGATLVERATDASIRKGCSVYAILQDPEFLGELSTRARQSVEAFVGLLDRHETRLCEPLADQAAVLREFIEETGYLADLARTCKTPEEAVKREGKVREMMRWFEENWAQEKGGLQDFLDDMLLRQEKEAEDEEEQGRGVTLITLHAAKGLEYPHVYLVGLEEGVLPHDRSKVEGTVDEERRLLYVGITRARKTLCLSWCRSRVKYGSAAPCMMSSFVKEFDPEWIEHRDVSEILNAPVQQEAAKARFDRMLAFLDGIPE